MYSASPSAILASAAEGKQVRRSAARATTCSSCSAANGSGRIAGTGGSTTSAAATTVSVSLRELTEICAGETGRDVPMAAVPETASVNLAESSSAIPAGSRTISAGVRCGRSAQIVRDVHCWDRRASRHPDSRVHLSPPAMKGAQDEREAVGHHPGLQRGEEHCRLHQRAPGHPAEKYEIPYELIVVNDNSKDRHRGLVRAEMRRPTRPFGSSIGRRRGIRPGGPVRAGRGHAAMSSSSTWPTSRTARKTSSRIIARSGGLRLRLRLAIHPGERRPALPEGQAHGESGREPVHPAHVLDPIQRPRPTPSRPIGRRSSATAALIGPAIFNLTLEMSLGALIRNYQIAQIPIRGTAVPGVAPISGWGRWAAAT